MSDSYRYIILLCFLFSSNTYAFDVYFEPLYWKATETAEWVLINDLNQPNQNITYKTISFNYDPGFRVGCGIENDTWGSNLSYTYFHTKASDSVSGNLVSTFMGGKLVQDALFFYRSGQVNFTIDFNVLDWDLSKRICVTDSLEFRPVIGLRGSKINQKIITNFQGLVSITEIVKNNFTGMGPKAGIEGQWTFCRFNDYQFSLVADFTTSYMWGRWNISDVTHTSTAATINTIVGGRNFGAFTLQALIGINMNYNCFAMKLGYELGDWFNQYQILDDGTGAHNNNLVLQGLTLRLTYSF